MQKARMPVLFIGHGNPMNAIERNEFHQCWEALAHRLPKPQAILCISAHWETQGIYVTAAERPATIHDFYGFPETLFAVQYPAPGAPHLARRTVELLSEEGAALDPERGLDHGAWSVLTAMYPDADIPVVQLSIDTREPGTVHYGIGQKLAPLRHEGVLIIASGNIVHNLRAFNFRDPAVLDWALQCDEDIKQRIVARDHEALMLFDSLGPNASLAIPTPEHFLPLLYVLGLRDTGESLRFFNSTVISSISMTSVIIGEL